MPVFKLSKESLLFPPGALADHDGLLAYGGDLSVARLLSAYSSGIFPWYNPDEEILWWCPHKRFVIFPEEIHVSRSMRKLMASGKLVARVNEDFPQIIAECRRLREGDTWLGDAMQTAYMTLFDAGYVMCVGVYNEAGLVGGLYGVRMGRCFFGESMFSLAPNGSKAALIHLCHVLAAEKFAFVDCQFHTPHLERMGGRYISWEKYRRLLRENVRYV